MFFTMESARLPCWTTLSRLSSFSVACQFFNLSPHFFAKHGRLEAKSFKVHRSAPPTARRNYALTKLSGFLISWAMPAVSWPRDAELSLHDPAAVELP